MSTPVRWRRGGFSRDARDDGDEREPALSEHDRRGIEAIRRRLDAEFADATDADTPDDGDRALGDVRSRRSGRVPALLVGLLIGCVAGSAGTVAYLSRSSTRAPASREAWTPAPPMSPPPAAAPPAPAPAPRLPVSPATAPPVPAPARPRAPDLKVSPQRRFEAQPIPPSASSNAVRPAAPDRRPASPGLPPRVRREEGPPPLSSEIAPGATQGR